MASSATPLISKLDTSFVSDSLAYFDAPLSREDKIHANGLIDEELKRFPRSKNYIADILSEDNDRLLTPAMKEMLELAEKSLPIDGIDESRYGLPDLESLDRKTPAELLRILELTEAQLMYAEHRRNQLGIMGKYASADYRQASSRFRVAADSFARKSTELKRETFEIHRERRREHAELGTQIKDLEQAWNDELTNIHQLKKALAQIKESLDGFDG